MHYYLVLIAVSLLLQCGANPVSNVRRPHRILHPRVQTTQAFPKEILRANDQEAQPIDARRKVPLQSLVEKDEQPAHAHDGDHHPVGDDGSRLPCPSCAERRLAAEQSLSEENIREYRIDMIKHEILQKLALDRPPNITKSARLPDVLLREETMLLKEQMSSSDRDSNDVEAEVEEIFVLAKAVTCREKSDRMASCFALDFNGSAVNSVLRVNHTFLAVKIKLNEIGPVNVTVSEIGETAIVIGSLQTILKDSWLHFKIKHRIAQRWVESGEQRIIQISCDGCLQSPVDVDRARQEGCSVYLKIKVDETRRRKKRAVECDALEESKRECCRAKLTVSFEEIGWGDWVLQPREYSAYYCTGSCYGMVLPEYKHTSVIQRKVMLGKGDDIKKAMAPCCNPTRTSSLSIIYRDPNGFIMKKILHDMIVEKCGCS